MKITRREFSLVAGSVFAGSVVSRLSWAQSYPVRPVRIVVPYGAGGTADILARLIGQWLSDRLGQPFVIENRPGASGSIGTEAVVNARPDGYTLHLSNTADAINATLYETLNYNFIRDTAPVVGIMRAPNVMEVNPSFPVRTVPEFIAYAKANPGKITMASGGTGTALYVFGELFSMTTGIEMLHVPYRGGEAPALADLLGEHVQVMFGTLPSSIEYIITGKLRALAVTTATRSDALPDVPTVGEIVPGYEASTFLGVSAPKSTPVEIIEKLNKEINAALADGKIRVRLADLGGLAFGGSPTDFGKLIAADTEKWARVVKFSGAKAD
jgi:tripartite-type tricarboxylate transporter receptor subunit TctC